jgi:hypothetical protein
MKKSVIILILFAWTINAIAQETDEYGNGETFDIKEIALNDAYFVKLKQISENEYTVRKKESEHLRHEPYKATTDIVEARKMLGKNVKSFEVYNEEQDNRYNVVEITFKDGVKKRFDWRSLDEYGFIAYYPELKVLILNHEADGDHPIDLNDSANEHVGNPHYHALSPDKQLRINGYYPGGAWDGVWYFLEKWNPKKKKYEFINYLSEETGENYVFSFLFAGDWFWTSNSKVFFRIITSYGGYYEMEIIEK